MNMIRTTVIMLTILTIHSARADPKLVFYTLFTPIKLASAATFIHHHYSITPRPLTFLSAPSDYYRMMVVPLILPEVIETNDGCLGNIISVALETSFGGVDSDPSFGVSDGHRFIGAFTADKTNYKDHAPCFGYEGASGTTLTNTCRDPTLPKPSETQYYPGRFKMQLSLSDRWGTCFVPLDGGFSREMVYQGSDVN